MEIINEHPKLIFIVAVPSGYLAGKGRYASVVGLDKARIFSAKHHALRALSEALNHSRIYRDILPQKCEVMAATLFESEFVYV